MNDDITTQIKCRELIAKARMWFRERAHKKAIEELTSRLVEAREETKKWNAAWHEQREITGKSYWDGYASGKKVAIAWHSMEAERRKNAMNAFTRQEDKASMEFDVRYHEFSAEKIAECGVSVRTTSEAK